MNISFRESCFIKKLPNMEGAFGYLATHKTLPNGLVIKVINNLNLEKESTIEELLKSKAIKNSGYPLEEYREDGKLQGFIMPFFNKAYTFDYVINREMFTHEERLKAAIDCTIQLKQFHKKGYFLNDIALSNQLIDKKGGHLIDFDAASKSNSKKTESHYNLTLNGRKLNPSYNTDKIRQALTNLSLIYKINFEEIINDKTTDVNSLFSLFKDNKEIFNLLYSYLSSDSSKPYFDILKDNLKDEEKVMFESAKIYRKTNNLV